MLHIAKPFNLSCIVVDLEEIFNSFNFGKFALS
jgi:hypothetical protein